MKKNSSGCKGPKASKTATRATNVTVGMDLGDKTRRQNQLLSDARSEALGCSLSFDLIPDSDVHSLWSQRQIAAPGPAIGNWPKVERWR
jgi:hypothetical protein